MSTNPTPGRIVQYRLHARDAHQITRRRSHALASGIMTQDTGAQVHFGNPVREGDVLPCIVTRATPTVDVATYINGQVILDGNDTLWVTSVEQGDEPGQWTWPVIR